MSVFTVEVLLKNKAFQLTNTDVITSREITSVYIGDLLSWVMSHAKQNCAWITVQTHINIVAVAVLRNMTCIILPEGSRPDADTLEKAKELNLPILTTDWTAFEIAVYLKA